MVAVTTRFQVYVDGSHTEYATFEVAARAWNVSTFDRPVPGGISVQQFEAGLMVRDGWLVHVHNDGTVYVNPWLTLAIPEAYCTWHLHDTVECGDPAIDTVDGQPLCPQHLGTYQALLAFAKNIPEDD